MAVTYREENGRLIVGPERLWAHVEKSDPDNIFAVAKDGRILVDLPPACAAARDTGHPRLAARAGPEAGRAPLTVSTLSGMPRPWAAGGVS